MIRVAIDGQTFASPDADRGIGVYLKHLLRHMPEAPNCRFELMRWGAVPAGLPRPDDLPTVRLSDAGPADDIDGTTPLSRASARNWAVRRQVRESGADVAFNPNPLQPGVEPLSRPGLVPLVATVHDLTPLVLPDLFLGSAHQTFESFYRARLEHLVSNADHLIADSEATRQDLIRFLRLPSDQITTVHCGLDPVFRPDGIAKYDAALFEWLESGNRQGGDKKPPIAPGRYLLAVGGYNPKKNFERLFEAFGKLTETLSGLPLVLAGPLDDGDWRRLVTLRDRYSPSLLLRRAGYVDDTSLAAFYRNALLLAFPSLHEGFGLPVLEAMACGCPVVAGEAGAVPEVTAGAARLCDPTSVDSIAEALDDVLRSATVRDRLRLLGPARAGHFSWRRTAMETARVLEQTARRRFSGSIPILDGQNRKGSKLRLLWYSPLPPDPGGVSAYSASMLQEIGDDYEITLVRDSQLQPIAGLEHYEVISPEAASDREADLCVYHMGNNLAQCAATYDALRIRPGLTIVHDLNIHGFLLEHLVRSRPNAGQVSVARLEDHPYYQALTEAHGEAGAEQATRVLEDGGFPDIAHYPCYRLLTNSSLGLITHSRWGRDRLEANADPAPVHTLPLGIEHPLVPPPRLVEELRHNIGAQDGELVMACAGFLEPNRRLDHVLLALAELKRRGTPSRLILAGGADEAMRRWLEEIAQEQKITDRVHWRGFLKDDNDFLATLGAADVVVHLRHPTNGESSATVLRALSIGRPVIVSAADSYRELPDSCCWKVDADHTEIPLLAEYLDTLAKRPEVRAAMAEAGRRHIALYHAWPQAAACFRSVISRLTAARSPLSSAPAPTTSTAP